MKLIRRYPEFFILTVAAFITRLWSLFTPAAVVFDEVYFKAFAGGYLTGSYYFDIHPPLGKLLLAGWAWVAHMSPDVLAGTDPAVLLRVLPAVAGALIIPVFYLFMRSLGASRRIAALGASLLLLDNALLVESRFILIDSMLILFGLSAITLFLYSRRHSGRARLGLLAASAACAGLAASTKWTGLAALGLVGTVWLSDHVRRPRQFSWPQRITEAAAIVLLPLSIYVGVFFTHFSLLNHAGPGDAFMSVKFQSTITGNINYDPATRMNLWDKTIELNRVMWQSEEGLKTATHPYSSKWSSWPLMMRPVYFWQGSALADGRQGNIYLLGNPVIWWGVLVIVLAGILASSKAFGRLKPYRFALGFLALGYVMNLLPFSRIERVMFLYHYFFALILCLAFAMILLGALGDYMRPDKKFWQFSSPSSRNLFVGVLAAAVLGFAYFAPLSYGLPLTPAGLEQHMWLKSWR